MDEDERILPAHIEETVRSIAELHAEHDRRASLYQRAIARLIDRLGRPSSTGVIAVFIGLWICTNVALPRLHVAPFDAAPFAYLQGIISAAALFMTVLILTSQRHENRLAEHRSQLTLELAMVSEQKIAKVIELVERQRRDNPQITNRVDEEAAAMATPADPQAIFDAIAETRGEIVAGDRPAAGSPA